jgi:oligopeptidase A
MTSRATGEVLQFVIRLFKQIDKIIINNYQLEAAMENPLLLQGPFPNFSQILPELIEPALRKIIEQNQQRLTNIFASNVLFTWENLILAIEEMDDNLSKMWSPVSHLHSVMESDALRAAYNACIPLITNYHTDFLQNEQLYAAVQSIADSFAYHSFNDAQKKVITNMLRDFRLAGVNLPPDAKIRFAQLQILLSKLSTQFAENVLDATNAWKLLITDQDELGGLSAATIAMLAQNAKQADKTGWLLTLEYPCYAALIKNSTNRSLREQIYTAYVTRASDQGPSAGQWDNTSVMNEMLLGRHEMAQLLGFASYAEYSLVPKMADKPDRVLGFLHDLLLKAKPFADREIAQLQNFARTLDGLDELKPWDVAFYAEKLRQSTYDISQEELSQYFPAPKVLAGMFTVMQRLFGINVVEQHGADVWHPQVQLFAVYAADGQLRGYFYTDLYARAHKRDGAWMDECRVRRYLSDGTLQNPIAFLTCNFTRPLGDKPAYLTHDEVQTVFHEFGHCLHHLLTQVDYSPVSGINGVPWDAVEFPSQFFEHWCWNMESLTLISAHAETGDTVPVELFQKLVAAKNFGSGLQMLRQLEFALFDFRLHLEFDPQTQLNVETILAAVRKETATLMPVSFNRFAHSFSHIFAGSYGAGYYSYKWAEVLSSDAFSKFEEEGIFDRATGQLYLTSILEKGGVYHPMDLFIAFRGREPSIDALLRHSALV